MFSKPVKVSLFSRIIAKLENFYDDAEKCFHSKMKSFPNQQKFHYLVEILQSWQTFMTKQKNVFIVRRNTRIFDTFLKIFPNSTK